MFFNIFRTLFPGGRSLKDEGPEAKLLTNSRILASCQATNFPALLQNSEKDLIEGLSFNDKYRIDYTLKYSGPVYSIEDAR